MAEANSPFSLKDSIMAAIVPAIAEYIDEVEEIFISDINQESDFYNFNINVILKGVTSDGE